MCYAKCHNVNNFHLNKLFMLMNGIILAMNGRDTLSLHDIEYHSGVVGVLYWKIKSHLLQTLLLPTFNKM